LLLSEYRPAYLSLDIRDDVIVATFTISELNDDANLEQLGHELFVLIDQFGCRKLIVDLSKIEFISSSAVGKIIKLHRKLERIHGNLALCSLSDTVTRALQASNLLDYFNVVDDVDKAVDMLN